MIYRFKSRATGDLVLLGPDGDQLLKALGREPAPRGIIEVAAMPAAVEALQAAIAAEAQALRAEGAGPDADAAAEDDVQGPHGERAVSFRQRAWPMIEMLRRSHAEGHPVVWGV